MVVNLLCKRFGVSCEMATREENRVAEDIIEMLASGRISGFDEQFTEATLDYDISQPADEVLGWPTDEGFIRDEECAEDDQPIVMDIEMADDPDYHPPSISVPTRADKIDDSYLERAYRFWTKQDASSPLVVMESGSDRRKSANVMNQFKKITNMSILYKFQALLRRGRPGLTMRMINERVNEWFAATRAQYGTVHDQMIQCYALRVKQELDPEDRLRFCASPIWVARFKQKFNIVSLKITHRVSRTFSSDEEKLKESALDFVLQIKGTILEHNLSHSVVFNFDQSRFEKEAHRGRTLGYKGCGKVLALAGSKSALTHSNMIFPGISMSGELLAPMYVLVSEASGHFPETYVHHFQVPPNLKVFASKSPNMTKQDLGNFLQTCFWPSVLPILKREGTNSLLLLVDSWSSNKDGKFYDERVPAGVDFRCELIPPRTTGLIQPLDVGFFRTYKNFVKHITDSLVISGTINIWSRENWLKLQSFAHFTFSAPRFREFIKYAFYSPGYLQDHPQPYQTPIEYCFYHLNHATRICQISDCTDFVFAKCAHCELSLCLEHTLIQLHIYKCEKSIYKDH